MNELQSEGRIDYGYPLATTSREAYESLAPKLPTIDGQVFTAIIAKARTCEEVEKHLGMKHQTVSGAMRRLAQAHRIVNTGERRKTSSGAQAFVWRCRYVDEVVTVRERPPYNVLAERVQSMKEDMASILSAVTSEADTSQALHRISAIAARHV